MNIEEIIERIEVAVAQLIAEEQELIRKNISERFISYRLTDCLKPLFDDYNVDPEYNLDIDNNQNHHKALSIAAHRLVGIKSPNDTNIYKITPDIIIHIRGRNDHNLVVIEVKKSKSNSKKNLFDEIKLETLTTDLTGNHYNYFAGIAIKIGVGQYTGQAKIKIFQNGQQQDQFQKNYL